MAIIKNASYKGIKSKREEIEKRVSKQKNGGLTSNGGFLDRSLEAKYKRALSSWRNYFIDNKEFSKNITFINELTIKNKGDVTKNKDFMNSYKVNKDRLNKLLNTYKSSKDLNENSIIRLWMNIGDYVTKSTTGSAIKVAYEESFKHKTNFGYISDIFVMCHQIMVSFVVFGLGTFCNDIIIDCEQFEIGDGSRMNQNEKVKEIENIVEDVQDKFRTFICDVGFVAYDVFATLSNIKDLNKEIKNAIETQKEGDKAKKSSESLDLAERSKISYEFSQEAWVIDDSEDFSKKGQEDGIVVTLIVVASIVGLFVLIAGIRRAIYVIGTIKTDIQQYITVDVVTIMMNIESLKKKQEETSDPKEKKRLQNIIDKQQKFVDKFLTDESRTIDESMNKSNEADYEIESEDNSDNSYYNSDGSTSDSGDYQIDM